MNILSKLTLGSVLFSVLHLAYADEQYKIIASTFSEYLGGGMILNQEDKIRLPGGHKLTVESTSHKGCLGEVTGPYADQNLAGYGMTFLKSIKCLAEQRGAQERHFCFTLPLDVLELQRSRTDTTERVSISDNAWWDNWEIGQATLTWPLDVVPVKDGERYQLRLHATELTVQFHQLPDGLSPSEQDVFMRMKQCFYQSNGVFELNSEQ